jgi:hypothetical protein
MMRLINTTTLALEEFSGAVPPFPYAILSHCWGADSDEVSYEDMKNADALQAVSSKPGYQKIKHTCRIARDEYQLQYAWVDTCSIDKSSSAELSEAINSMFLLYKRAKVCFAFLEDFHPDPVRFGRCKWFSRGWTLQELIAPREVIFFDDSWTACGDKRSLAIELARITGIHSEVLNHQRTVSSIPVAVRMSWASSRRTKRTEDMAYCLMGIFDVNMPMLYGEGEKAFNRLQEEIIKDNPDMSIFCWIRQSKPTLHYSGLLATSPADFSSIGALRPQEDAIFNGNEFSITNRGIHFQTPANFVSRHGYFILALQHRLAASNGANHLGVYLRKVGPDLFVRAEPSKICNSEHGREWSMTRTPVKLESFRVLKSLSFDLARRIEDSVLQIKAPPNIHQLMPSQFAVEPTGSYDRSKSLLYAGHTGAFLGHLHFTPNWAEEFDSFVVVCRYDSQYQNRKQRWRFAVLTGEEWELLKPRYQQRFNFESDMFSVDSLSEDPSRRENSTALLHLYDSKRVRFASIKWSGTQKDGRDVNVLEIHAHENETDIDDDM